MTVDIDTIKSQLEAKRTELRRSLESLTEAYPFSVSVSGTSRDAQDWEEEALDFNEAEAESSIRLNQEALLAEVEGALKRIEQGTYGICVQCRRPIPEKRLEILPWATRDIACQGQLEARQAEISEVVR